MGRFEDAPDHVIEMMNRIRNSAFPELRSAKIKVLYDTKKRKSGGKLVLGRMQKANDLIKCLTEEEVNDGYDYVMFLDKMCFEYVEDADRERLIRHELLHCDVDLESDNNPYKLRGHEIETFYDEIEYNKEDPRWLERCITVAESMYEAE